MTAIYRIWNTRNGKSYIGQSHRPYHRILEHLMPPGQGSSAIQDDLLKYPSNSWQWKIIADTGGKKAYELWSAELSQLERKYIHQFDSLSNGYNQVDGSPVYHTQTLNEARVSWNGKSFHRSQMQQVIYSAIDNYQCLQIHGMNTAQYQKQQEIIAQYGSLEAYEREREHEQERQRQRDASYVQRFGVTYGEYEGIIAQHGSWEAYQEHQANRTGCSIVFIVMLLLTIIGLASGC